MEKNTWLYYAARANADAARTFELAISENVIVRSVENVNGALIAGVGRLKPGDQIALVYRGLRDGLVATLAHPTEPHPRAPAIQVLDGEFARELAGNDYGMRKGGTLEVLLLEEVVRFSLSDDIPNLGMGTLHCITETDLEKRIWDARIDSYDEDTTSSAVTAELSSEVIESAIDSGKPSAEVTESFASPKQRLFDRYIMIDWSSRNQPTTGADSIWVAYIDSEGSGDAKNFSTRKGCVAWLIDTLRENETMKLRTLVGFDFAFSYPRGYFELLGFEDWRELLEYYAANVEDSPQNVHNRDNFARRVNEQIGTGPGPFWGVVNNAACDRLETRRIGRFTFPYNVDGVSLREFRKTEEAARLSGANPQSVWKLNQGVAVGGQVIMGLPYLHQLLTQLESIKAWPFETGWCIDRELRTHIAEILPSLISTDRYATQITSKEICRDEAQVRACCDYAIELDSSGLLEDYFGRPDALVDDNQLSEKARNEEGWILWSNLSEYE